MEGSKFAFALNCGLSAVTACLSLLTREDHLLTVDDVYGGTQRYLRKHFCPQTGIAWDMVDMTDFNNFKAGFKKNTKMVWVESPTNPTLKCLDIQRIAAYCK
jgi:cystathionine gamma-lyase